MLRPTRRSDGKRYANVRVTFSADRTVVITALAAWADREDVDLDTVKISRAKLYEIVSEGYFSHGEALSLQLADDLDTSIKDADELHDWAASQVARLYPDWSN